MRHIYGYFIHSAVIDPVMFRWVNIYVQIKWPLLKMAFMVMFSWKKVIINNFLKVSIDHGQFLQIHSNL